jgi:hypothetical protein
MAVTYQNRAWINKNDSKILYVSSGSGVIQNDTQLVYCDTTSGPVTITLLPLDEGWDVNYKLIIMDYGTDGYDGSANTNPITIVINQIGENINGNYSYVINQNGGTVLIRPVDNKNWFASGTAIDVTNLQTELNNADLYLSFTSAATFELFAPFNMKITSVDKSNAATITVKVNGSAYTFNNTITKFDNITVESNGASNVIVKGEKI